MAIKLQSTGLNKNIGQLLTRLETWAKNPWRRFSLLLIVLLSGFLIGSSIGMLNGVLALMDPVGAFFVVLILEIMVRLRRYWPKYSKEIFTRQIMDMARIGLLYGLLLDGFKLL